MFTALAVNFLNHLLNRIAYDLTLYLLAVFHLSLLLSNPLEFLNFVLTAHETTVV